jgi:pimeloyl-ACP methyl ester carboxylesterase
MRLVPVLGLLAALSLPAWAEDVTVPAPPGELHGTLLKSGAKGPAVLIIAGSGPTDRDGNSTLGLSTNTYKMLAEGLAAKGISSLRYDKRGVGESRAAMVKQSDLRIQTYADDAGNMAAALRKQMAARCVWLLGHSEGALLAELVAQKPAGICGLVLISGAGQKIADVMRQQLSVMPEPARGKALAAIAELEAGRLVPDPPAQPLNLFYTEVQPYLISWMAADPAQLVSRIKLPVLILQGETDIQVSVTDAKALAAAKPDAKLALLPGVNHILKTAPADRNANMAAYADPNLPLAPGVVDTIAAFVQEHRK